MFAFILVYGYNAISGFREKSEQIAYIKFKTDLVSAVKRISPDYGTLKREEFFIGGDYTEVCFVKNHDVTDSTQIADSLISGGYGIIADSVSGGADKNVFLFAGTLQESFDAGTIDIDNDAADYYICIDTINGKARIELLGQGDHTRISTYQ